MRRVYFGMLGIVVAGFLGLIMLRTGHDELPVRDAGFVLSEAPSLPHAPNLTFPEGVSGLVEDAETVPVLPDRRDRLPEGALAGQRVWRVDPARIAEAIDRAERAGLAVRGVIPELGLLHVAGDEAVLNETAPDEGLDFVYPVSLPPYPDEREWGMAGLAAFHDAAIRFLGIEEVPAEWGSGVRIALLDTGIADHSALAGANIMRAVWQEDSGLDSNGHGTAMSGLLVGRDPYARGLAPAATLLSLPVLDRDGHGDTFRLAQGIVAAVQQGARVINVSAGSMGNSTALADAVRFAVAQGAVIVAAAGNDGANFARYPAAYADVIGVTSVDANGHLPAFANTGPAVNLAGPGFGVYSSWLEDGYVSVNGSSAAAPLVAGAIAMLMSESGISAQAAADLVLAYTSDAGPPGPDAVFGAGVLNVDRLLRREARGVAELALIPPYADLTSGSDSSVPLYLSVQNQGTTTLAGVRLDVVVDGVAYTHAVGRLDPGVTSGTQLPVELQRLMRESGVPIEMRAVHSGMSADAGSDQQRLSTVLRVHSMRENPAPDPAPQAG